MPRHDRLIRQALEVAGRSAYRWRVGCVVTEGSRVLGHSPNKFRNSPLINPDHATQHAEMATLAKIAGGSTAYVARLGRAGEPRMARPCDVCMEGLTARGIRLIVFTTDGGGYAAEKISL